MRTVLDEQGCLLYDCKVELLRRNYKLNTTCAAPELPAESQRIKWISNDIEATLRRLMDDSKGGRSPQDILEEALCTYEDHISQLPGFLDVELIKLRKVLCPEDTATEGQRRRLLLLHNALVKVIFTCYADQLLLSPNDRSKQHIGTDMVSDTKKIDNRTFTKILRNFDGNWKKLRRDSRVWKQPRAWAEILMARSWLSIALARACLASNDCAESTLLCGITFDTTYHETISLSKKHIDDAKELEKWIYYHFRNECINNGWIAPWMSEWFHLRDVIESAIWDYEHGAEYYEQYHQPMYFAPCIIRARWDTQIVDMNVPYDFTIG